MPGRQGSPFANPYKIGPDGSRAEVLTKYRKWLLEQLSADAAFAAQFEALRGQVLGCWCKPKDCHGDIIVEILEGRPPPPEQGTLF